MQVWVSREDARTERRSWYGFHRERRARRRWRHKCQGYHVATALKSDGDIDCDVWSLERGGGSARYGGSGGRCGKGSGRQLSCGRATKVSAPIYIIIIIIIEHADTRSGGNKK